MIRGGATHTNSNFWVDEAGVSRKLSPFFIDNHHPIIP
jgi:hypothetical protein